MGLYSTQAELLEHLGKNPNDRSLFQRMLARGDVAKDEDGMYYIVSKDAIIDELKQRIKELGGMEATLRDKEDGVRHLSRRNNKLEEENCSLRNRVAELEEVVKAAGGSVNLSELEEAKVNAEYWEKECRRYWRLINNVISVCYRKLKGLLGSRFTMSEEEFKEAVIEEVKMSEE